MDPSLGLCRLCFESAVNGIDIFRRTRRKQTYSEDIQEHFQISLDKKSEWSSDACQKCIEFIKEIKTFKNRILETQELLLNVTPELEVSSPIEEVFFDNRPASPAQFESDTEERKEGEKDEDPSAKKIKTEVEPPIKDESPLITEPDPPPSTFNRPRRGTRKSENLIEMSVKEEEPLQPRRSLTRKERVEEANDPNFAEPRQPKKLIEEMDRLNRKEDRKKKLQRDITLKKGEYHECWDARFRKKYPHLEPLVKQLKLDVCDVCHVATESLGRLFSHMEREHRIHRFQAYVMCCGKRFFNGNISSHLVYHDNNEAFKCHECQTCYLSKYLLSKHVTAKHLKEEDMKLRCAKCNKGFPTKEKLGKHEDKHQLMKFDCEECKDMFLTAEDLQSHIDFEHRNVPRHICDICGRGYKLSRQLLVHQKRHQEVRTVGQCDICGLYFRDVKFHKTNAHGNNLRPCPDCGKMLSPKYMAKHKLIVHDRNERFKCTVCPKGFTTLDRLKAHMDIHMGVRYPCHFCPETYGATCNRQKHMQSKHRQEYEEYKIQQNLDKANRYLADGSIPV